jgi:hypothetical protein
MHDPHSTLSLPARRRRAARAQLEHLIAESTKRHHHRRWPHAALVGALGAAVLVTSAAVAIAYVQSEPVTVKTTARCYTVDSLAGGTNFSGTTIAHAGRPDTTAQVNHALSVCAALWRQGFLKHGARTALQPGPNEHHRVPPLAACTLPNGTAAVFPGRQDTCARLGLPSVTA